MVALILAQANDAHALAVASKLDALNSRHRMWSYADLIEQTSVAFSTQDLARNYLQFNDGERIAFDEITAVWFRRTGRFQSPPMPEAWVESMIESESENAIGGILRSLDCLLVNHPGRDNDSLYKLYQLRQARRAGLIVPDTLVTNEPELVSQYYEKHEGKVIYKLIGERTNFCFPAFEFPAGIPTLPLQSKDLQHLEQVRLAPHLFQQRIEKEFEVRATVVGKEIFSARIDSQKGKSKLDWRMDYEVPMESMMLPDETHQSALALMRLLGLNYAAFDFCVDKNGTYYFLELNCAGQYLWLEERANLPISQQIALLLAGQAEPTTGN